MAILVISATSNNNFKVSQAIAESIIEKDREAEVVNLEELKLPLYTPPKESEGIPEKAKELTEKIKNADALVFSAPEYNGSIPPIVTNAIAWVSRSGDSDWRSAFNQKFVALSTHSGSGGTKILNSMRIQFDHLGCIVMPRPIVCNNSAPLNEKLASISQIMDNLIKQVYR